jgi:hypothetical protein
LKEVALSAPHCAEVLVAHQSATKVCRTGASERRRAAEQEGEDADVPELDQAGDGQHAQRQGEHAHRGLRRDQEPALVEMVGGKPVGKR